MYTTDVMSKLQKLNKPGSTYLFAYINSDYASEHGWSVGDEVEIEITPSAIILHKV